MRIFYRSIPLIGAVVLLCNSVFAQMSGVNVFLQGNFTEVGVAGNGSWGAGPVLPGYHPRSATGGGTSNLSVVYDYGHDGWTVGTPEYFGDYTYPGTPFEGWAMQANGARSDAFYTIVPYGTSFGNAIPATSALSGSNTSYAVVPGSATCGFPAAPSSAVGVWSGTTTGTSGGLNIRQTTSIEANASWVNVTTVFTNTSAAAIPGVYYWRTCDPDNDVSYTGDYGTNNRIVYQGDPNQRVFVGSRGHTYSNAYSGLGTKDCRAKCMIYTNWAAFPALIPSNNLDLIYAGTAGGLGATYYAQNDQTTSDIAMGLIYNIGTIAAGDSAIISYVYVFSDSSGLDEGMPDPQLVVNCEPQGPSLPAPFINRDTFNVCDHPGTTTLPVYIKYGSDKQWSWSQWSWSPATGLGSTTGLTNNINVGALAGPTTYTITGTNDGVGMRSCAKRIFYLTVLPCFSATNNGPICAGDTLHLDAHGDSTGATYLWYGPTGYSSVAQHTTRIGVTVADTGWYYVIKTVGTEHDTVSTHVVIKPKPVINATSNAPLCSGNTLTLTSSPDSVGETWSWTGPAGFTSVLSDPTRPSALTAYTGTYTVRATFNGCTDSAYTTVRVDSTPVVPSVSSNTPVCSGDTLFLSSSDLTAGVAYSWTGPSLFASTQQNPSITNVPTTASGTYTVMVTLGTCTNSATTDVLIKLTPSPILGSNSPVCSGNLLNLTTTGPAGSTYDWTGPNSFTSSIQNPSIVPAITANTGTYSVIVTLDGCASPATTIYALVDTTPEVPTVGSNSSGAPGPTLCEGDTLKLTAFSATAGTTYSWVGPNSFASTEQNPMIVHATPAASGFYTVTAAIGTCTVAAVTSVTITPTPPLAISSNSPVCSGNKDTIQLHAISGAGATFEWSGPYTFSSMAQDPTRYPVVTEYAGVYHAIVYLNGCYASADLTVVVNETPPAPWVKWIDYCQYFPAQPLQATGSNILWYSSSSGTDVGSSVPPTPSTDTVGYSFYYTNQTVLGCPSAIDSIKVTVYPKPVVTVNNDTAVCPHDSVALIAADADAIAYYHWYPNMYLGNDTASPVVMAHPETNTSYYVVASNQYGCTDTGYVSVTVRPDAVIHLEDSVTIYPGETYQIDPSTNCAYVRWTPPGGLSSPYISNPVAAPETNTKYVVTGVTEWGCRTKDSISVYVSTEPLLAMPNAFAPGNGLNSKFKVVKRGVAQLRYFRVYDRWGIMVYETTNIDEGWDGTYKGVPQPLGVFVYEISAISESGKTFMRKGNVTLLR